MPTSRGRSASARDATTRRRFAWSIAISLFALGHAAQADRVLPGSAGPPIFAALGRAEPQWRLVSARIDRDRVRASLCLRDQAAQCFAVELNDPRRGCVQTIAGPWCVSFPDAAPPDDARERLLGALGLIREADAWVDVGPPSDVPRAIHATAAGRIAHPWVLAFFLVGLPLVVGVALGVAVASRLRRAGRYANAWRAGLTAIPPLAAWIVLPALPQLAATDVIGIGALLGVGCLAGSLTTRKTLAPVAAVTLFSLVLLEVGARCLPQRAARFANPDEAAFVFATPPALASCSPMYPDSMPGAFRARTAGITDDRSIVLHVGDSMVEGVGVAMTDAFPAVLEQLLPGSTHVNAGFANSSIDAELLVTRTWLPRLRARRVVLYVFGYNDLAEVDRATACCPGGPLLDHASDLRPRCSSPAHVASRRDRLSTSPAPYPLRVATAVSAFARTAVVAWTAITEAMVHRGSALPDARARWQRYEAMLTEMNREIRARGVALSVVYLPARASFETGARHDASDREVHDRIVAMCRALGIELLDPWDAIESEVRRVGVDRVYLPAPDIHFTVEGHRALATWLAPQLR